MVVTGCNYTLYDESARVDNPSPKLDQKAAILSANKENPESESNFENGTDIKNGEQDETILEIRKSADAAIEALMNAINDQDTAALYEIAIHNQLLKEAGYTENDASKALEYYNAYFKGSNITNFEYISTDFTKSILYYRLIGEDGISLDIAVDVQAPVFYGYDSILAFAHQVDWYLERYTRYIVDRDVEELASLIYANDIGEPYPQREMEKLMEQCRYAAQRAIDKYDQSFDLDILEGRFAGSIEGQYFLCKFTGTGNSEPAEHTIQIYCDMSGFNIKDEWCSKVEG